MVVLIVTKTTNYELHGAVIEAKVERGQARPDALERLRTAHREHYETLSHLRQALGRRGIAFDEVSRDFPRPWSKAYDIVITVGGDGTLLAATHQMPSGGVIAGIRSSPSSVGFLCSVGPAEVEALVAALAAKTLPTVTVHRVKAAISRGEPGAEVVTEPVLNDLLYANTNPAATTRYRLTIGDQSEVHRSSGIWVATAIGSPAAILAAGGERRPPVDPAFQYRVRELYRLGHAVPVLDGGFFDPGQVGVEIENRCQSAILALDGQHGVVELAYGDTVRFLRAAPIDLVAPITNGTKTP